MPLADQLLDSWDRQCRILDSVASLVNEDNKHFKPSPDGWSLDRQLAHCHNVRSFFLSEVAPELTQDLVRFGVDDDGEVTASLAEIALALKASAVAIRAAVSQGLADGKPLQGEHVTYDNAVLLLQHMVWHEGWHTGQIFLALRLNGQEPPEEWEEPNVWGVWRTERWE